jgi:AraC-like DNA-binding protein
MGGEFTEVRGTAHDLQAWHELLTGDAAPFQRIEAAREAGGFTGRFWRVVLDQVTANLIEITASEHAISRTAEHIEVSIGDVAARWGYPDQAYFSRLFRRTFDETPREWRARAASLLKILQICLRGNGSGASAVSCYVRSLLIQDVTIAGLYRRGTGRWGVALAVFIAIALTVGLSAALAVTRIDNGTDALGGLTHIVASVSASSASAGR